MRNMKRWLAALLAVVMVLPSLLIPGMAAENGFKDVPENSWYASAVEYVNEKGYMTVWGMINSPPTPMSPEPCS